MSSLTLNIPPNNNHGRKAELKVKNSKKRLKKSRSSQKLKKTKKPIQKTKKKKVVRFRIQIDKPAYYEGDTIKGKIFLKVTEPVQRPIKLFIKIKGYERSQQRLIPKSKKSLSQFVKGEKTPLISTKEKKFFEKEIKLKKFYTYKDVKYNKEREEKEKQASEDLGKEIDSDDSTESTDSDIELQYHCLGVGQTIFPFSYKLPNSPKKKTSFEEQQKQKQDKEEDNEKNKEKEKDKEGEEEKEKEKKPKKADCYLPAVFFNERIVNDHTTPSGFNKLLRAAVVYKIKALFIYEKIYQKKNEKLKKTKKKETQIEEKQEIQTDQTNSPLKSPQSIDQDSSNLIFRKKQISHSERFIVLEKPQIKESKKPLTLEKTKQFLFLGNKKVIVKTHLPKTVYSPGETIPLRFIIENHTKTDLKNVKVKLRRKMDLKFKPLNSVNPDSPHTPSPTNHHSLSSFASVHGFIEGGGGSIGDLKENENTGGFGNNNNFIFGGDGFIDNENDNDNIDDDDHEEEDYFSSSSSSSESDDDENWKKDKYNIDEKKKMKSKIKTKDNSNIYIKKFYEDILKIKKQIKHQKRHNEEEEEFEDIVGRIEGQNDDKTPNGSPILDSEGKKHEHLLSRSPMNRSEHLLSRSPLTGGSRFLMHSHSYSDILSAGIVNDKNVVIQPADIEIPKNSIPSTSSGDLIFCRYELVMSVTMKSVSLLNVNKIKLKPIPIVVAFIKNEKNQFTSKFNTITVLEYKKKPGWHHPIRIMK